MCCTSSIGQVPHHFMEDYMCPSNWQSAQCSCNATHVDGKPAYLCVAFYSLSGKDQTGPNVFFILSLLK